MGIDRRQFIKIAGLSTLFGLGGKIGWELLKPGQVEASLASLPQPRAAKPWATRGEMPNAGAATAKSCIEVCHRIHNVPDFANPVNTKDAVTPEEQIRWQVK